MASKSDVSVRAVKARKNLAPDAKLKAQMESRREAIASARAMKAATRGDEVATANSRVSDAGQPPLDNKPFPDSKSHVTSTKTARNSRPRNLRAPSGTTKATLGKSVGSPPKKTQAQMAREKLASAAAIKAREQRELRQAQLKKKIREASSKKPIEKETRKEPSPGKQLIQLFPPKKAKPKSRHIPEPGNKKPPIINATALLAAKYPNYFADNNDLRTKAESRTVFVVTSLILALIAFGWVNWDAINFQANGDFTYNSGLVGGITMLVILLYAFRKRARLLRKAGNMEVWYYFHLLGGVLGPLIIVFHTGFTLKSINSGVALFTMITIVLSGVFGRYIYTRIGYSLHRKLLAIKESEKQLMEMLHNYDSPLSEKIERRLSNFALSCLTGPRSILKLPMRLVAIRGAAAACYVKVSSDLSTIMKTNAKREGISAGEYKGRLSREKEQLREHISAVANIAHSHLFERVLVKWRILHIPLLYILVITGLFHVLAVHMY